MEELPGQKENPHPEAGPPNASARPQRPVSPFRSRTTIPHQGWDAINVAMAKCDMCSCAGRGVMYKCSQCKLSICRTCCEGGKLEIDSHHELDPNSVSWDIPSKPKRSRRTTGAQREGRAGRSARSRATRVWRSGSPEDVVVNLTQAGRPTRRQSLRLMGSDAGISAGRGLVVEPTDDKNESVSPSETRPATDASRDGAHSGPLHGNYASIDRRAASPPFAFENVPAPHTRHSMDPRTSLDMDTSRFTQEQHRTEALHSPLAAYDRSRSRRLSRGRSQDQLERSFGDTYPHRHLLRDLFSGPERARNEDGFLPQPYAQDIGHPPHGLEAQGLPSIHTWFAEPLTPNVAPHSALSTRNHHQRDYERRENRLFDAMQIAHARRAPETAPVPMGYNDPIRGQLRQGSRAHVESLATHLFADVYNMRLDYPTLPLDLCLRYELVVHWARQFLPERWSEVEGTFNLFHEAAAMVSAQLGLEGHGTRGRELLRDVERTLDDERHEHGPARSER